MKRRAHHRHSNRLPIEQEPAEPGRVERLQPRPEADVGIEWNLRLHPHEVLDRVEGRQIHALEQELAGQKRPVQRAPVEDTAFRRAIQAASPEGRKMIAP
jgi:hypothetical protein